MNKSNNRNPLNAAPIGLLDDIKPSNLLELLRDGYQAESTSVGPSSRAQPRAASPMSRQSLRCLIDEALDIVDLDDFAV